LKEIILMFAILACNPAPSKLRMPQDIQDYICDNHGFYTTIVPMSLAGNLNVVLVAFYGSEDKNKTSWIGTAMFSMTNKRIGPMIMFLWENGKVWRRGSNRSDRNTIRRRIRRK